MKESVDVPESYRRSLAGIDYTSPVCKINVAVNKIPNFLSNPNTSPDTVMPHHRCTIHLNCENSQMIEDAYQVKLNKVKCFINLVFIYLQDAVKGEYSKVPMIEMTIPSSLDPTLAPPGHHVCLFFTQFAPYHPNSGPWDEEKREEYANVIFDTVERLEKYLNKLSCNI